MTAHFEPLTLASVFAAQPFPRPEPFSLCDLQERTTPHPQTGGPVRRGDLLEIDNHEQPEMNGRWVVLDASLAGINMHRAESFDGWKLRRARERRDVREARRANA